MAPYGQDSSVRACIQAFVNHCYSKGMAEALRVYVTEYVVQEEADPVLNTRCPLMGCPDAKDSECLVRVKRIHNFGLQL